MDWEFTLLNYIQNNIRTDFLDKLMPVISFMGKLSLMWVIIAAACLCFRKTRKLGRSLTFDMIFNLIATTLWSSLSSSPLMLPFHQVIRCLPSEPQLFFSSTTNGWALPHTFLGA